MKAVMYGAGNIGRGFIAQLLSESGYFVEFIDVNDAVLNALNENGRYPVTILHKEGSEEVWVNNVSAVDGKDINAAAQAISNADIMATAVGVNVLKFIAKPIAEGIKRRWKNGNLGPLNIIICENLIGADSYLRELIAGELNTDEQKLLDEKVGFVEASIGRMVPVQTPEMQNGNILRVCVEAFDKLPLDKAAFKGEIPDIKNAILYSPFEYYIERKLYIHNMGHAATAYLGSIYGYTYIWEAIENPYIELFVLRAMTEAALSLAKKHKADCAELYNHVQDLIMRFGNRQLGDTVKRVGNDIKRKLGSGDRLVGAFNMCTENNMPPAFIKAGIAAALCFEHDETIKAMKPDNILKEFGRMDDETINEILKIKKMYDDKLSLKDILKALK
jgi:mannitol-1-phosphate 5-dehydrogenase